MWEEYQDFNFDHCKFETSIRYAKAIKIATEYSLARGNTEEIQRKA